MLHDLEPAPPDKSILVTVLSRPYVGRRRFTGKGDSQSQ